MNLINPIDLNKLLSKFELNNKFIRKESHRKNNKITYLSIVILKLFLIHIIKKIILTIIVFKLISKLPAKKHIGKIDIAMPSIINLST